MNKISLLTTDIENKIKKIVDLQSQLKKGNNHLIQEVHALKNIIEDQKVIIENLEKKLKILKIAKTLEIGKDNQQAKLKINELVREIDKCIALLNN
ncbi:MAG TPA: hypothetical protein PKZ21_04250 [Bacteroidales bacterium]|nr:hypothetical protein [Bacteroidales bacterium]